MGLPIFRHETPSPMIKLDCADNEVWIEAHAQDHKKIIKLCNTYAWWTVWDQIWDGVWVPVMDGVKERVSESLVDGYIL